MLGRMGLSSLGLSVTMRFRVLLVALGRPVHMRSDRILRSYRSLRSHGLIAPQGHFQREARHYLVWFQRVRAVYIIARLFRELDGALCPSHRLCHSGIVSATYMTAKFRGETLGDGP